VVEGALVASAPGFEQRGDVGRRSWHATGVMRPGNLNVPDTQPNR
jgi:hypothetical protein